MRKKNILLIDDSALMRRVISDIIESDQRFNVIGAAINGLEGLSMLQENVGKFDAVLLDINMPRMNGLELLEQIRDRDIRTTVIVVSSVTTKDAQETIRALELGAFDFITKPESMEELKSNRFSERLLECLTVATKRKREEPQIVISTEPPKIISTSLNKEANEETLPVVKTRKPVPDQSKKDKLVAIACSTGGPKALHSILPYLPKNIDAGLIIVQHMPEGFTKSLADRLDTLCEVNVKEAEDGEVIKKGWVYIAKGGSQLRVTKSKNGDHVLEVSKEAARNGLLPCADILYESLINTDYDEITCVVLTGMGSDGSAGITELSKNKNIHVIAQDMKSSIVYGMPRVIRATGLVNKVVSLHEVSDAIIKNVGVR